jgi:hypothetical protein
LEPKKLLKNWQDGKLFFEPVEYVGGHRYPPGSNNLSKEKGWMEEVLATQGLKHPNPREKLARE